MLEAMAAGCLVIGSDTAPVKEVIEDGKNGLLVDFFSPVDIANRVEEVLDNPDKFKTMRKAARQFITDNYTVKRSIALYMDLLQKV
jgi:glycosyltransferase involved in cell wall biosynthesis